MTEDLVLYLTLSVRVLLSIQCFYISTFRRLTSRTWKVSRTTNCFVDTGIDPFHFYVNEVEHMHLLRLTYKKIMLINIVLTIFLIKMLEERMEKLRTLVRLILCLLLCLLSCCCLF